jgi:Protein of unknown function (DUF2726).
MGQLVVLILVVVLIKLLVDNVKPMFNKNKSSPGGDFIDISEKWVSTDAMPYQKNDYLLNNRELLIFKRLNDILLNSRYSLYPHIRLADLLKVPPATQNRQEYMFRIKERSLDLVIFESAYLKPILVINLRKSEDGKQQQIADQFTEKALRAAGIASMDLDLNDPPEPEAIRDKLRTFSLEL